jgi:hypothetical protein
MEDSMCWEMDYQFYVEQQKAKEARIKREQRAGIIDNLLNDAQKQAEEIPIKEIVPAK